MLGWVLRRGLEGASGGSRGPNQNTDDTTQIEQPDTPAPVFAARALKSAIFGTPARPDDDHNDNAASMARRRVVDDSDAESRTPIKQPQGILLTPGTGTSRRKRVSFGNDVLDKAGTKRGKDKVTDDRPGKFPSSFESNSGDSASKRTKLTETMENSRRTKGTNAPRNSRERQQTRPNTARADDAEDEWEEADEDQCTQDVTVDLNEPHSRSGKYWKSEFEQYHQDAKAEMEKLLKYKQLAKSYAKMKDAEALDLNAKLKEEQEKVAGMEKKLADMAAQIAAKRATGDERGNPELIRDLAQQTAVAVEYRTQVQELADLLGNREDDEVDSRKRRRQAASPRTHKTLLETQRELRKARTQVKENGQLREEVEKLKSDLLFAEQRATKLAAENKRLAEEQPPKAKTDAAPSAQLQELEELREESREKDEELRRIKSEFEAYRADAEATQEDTRRILEKATEKINELRKEVKALKAGSVEGHKAKTSTSSLPEREPIKRSRDRRAHEHDRVGRAHQPSSDVGRRSLDLVESLGKKLNESKSLNLRDKYQEDADSQSSSTEEELANKPTGRPKSDIMSNRVNLDKPKWRPFIPRSPRNREYLGNDLNKRIVSSSEIPSGATPAPRHRFSSRDNQPPIDLLQDRFARLGMPEQDASAMLAANTSKSTLPPERRAAAIARIEQRKAEKRRAITSQNKENMRP